MRDPPTQIQEKNSRPVPEFVANHSHEAYTAARFCTKDVQKGHPLSTPVTLALPCNAAEGYKS
jgi:hypothetical protein